MTKAAKATVSKAKPAQRTQKRKPINLALQGGGTHGAFTWGVLDRLLEEDCFEIEGITGRRFFVIKSISDRVGIFQVNFESPCGKRKVTVHVR